MRCLLAWLLLAFIGGGLGPAARGDQTDPALPGLFEQLAAAADPAAAAPLEAAIWAIWTRHPDPLVEQLMGKAALAMRRGDGGQAERALDQVVALAPGYAEGWNRRATLYYLTGRPRDSLRDIEQVLRLEPRHFGALSGKGLVLVALDRPDEAIAAFTAALAVHPNMSSVSDNLEALWRNVGKDI